MSTLRATLRAYPTLLRVGLAEAIAYRAETLVWMLTNTMPLVNLALWTSIARDVPVGRYGQREFVAYFLCALIVRQMTGSWVMWEMSREIRMGTLSMRLLRPVHPLIAYSAENLAALPMRTAFVMPFAVIVLVVAGRRLIAADPLAWAAVPLSLAGAWLLTFLSMAMMGTLSFFIESALGVFEVWLALYFVSSGYLVPLDIAARKAPWVESVAHAMPFYYMNGFPIELMLGHLDRATLAARLGAQWGFVAAFLVGTVLLWRAGLRRYNAFGA